MSAYRTPAQREPCAHEWGIEQAAAKIVAKFPCDFAQL